MLSRKIEKRVGYSKSSSSLNDKRYPIQLIHRSFDYHLARCLQKHLGGKNMNSVHLIRGTEDSNGDFWNRFHASLPDTRKSIVEDGGCILDEKWNLIFIILKNKVRIKIWIFMRWPNLMLQYFKIVFILKLFLPDILPCFSENKTAYINVYSGIWH